MRKIKAYDIGGTGGETTRIFMPRGSLILGADADQHTGSVWLYAEQYGESNESSSRNFKVVSAAQPVPGGGKFVSIVVGRLSANGPQFVYEVF